MPDLENDLRSLFAQEAGDVDPAGAARILAPRRPDRATRWVPVLAVAVAAAVVVVIAVVSGRFGSVDSHASYDPVAPAPPMVTVGFHGVGVRVPAPWMDHSPYACETVYPGVLSVSNARADCRTGPDDGPPIEVYLADTDSQVQPIDDCLGGGCLRFRSFPAQHVSLIVDGAADDPRADAIIASAGPLPSDRVAVPVFPPGTTVAGAERIVALAGLNVGTIGGILGQPSSVYRVSPVSGTVVRRGGTLTLLTVPHPIPHQRTVAVIGTWAVLVVYDVGGIGAPATDGFRDVAMSLTLRSDNTLSGNDGCHEISGTYAVSGHDLRFYDLTSSPATCRRDPELASRLDRVRGVQGDALGQKDLIADDGAVALVLKASR